MADILPDYAHSQQLKGRGRRLRKSLILTTRCHQIQFNSNTNAKHLILSSPTPRTMWWQHVKWYSCPSSRLMPRPCIQTYTSVEAIKGSAAICMTPFQGLQLSHKTHTFRSLPTICLVNWGRTMARMEAEVKDEIKFGQLQKYKRPNSHGGNYSGKTNSKWHKSDFERNNENDSIKGSFYSKWHKINSKWHKTNSKWHISNFGRNNENDF